MLTVLSLAAVVSVFALTAGSAPWAQTYTTNPGTQGSYSYSQGSYNPKYNQGPSTRISARPIGALIRAARSKPLNQEPRFPVVVL